jgi:hypothetical protein
MTIFGKILLGLILATAAVLLIKGARSAPEEEVEATPEVSDSTEETTPTSDETATAEFKGSMKALIARGGNYKCTFKQDTEVGTSTGTVYISGKEMRGDFSSVVTVANTTIESHMISDGEFVYTWSPLMPTGMKMKVDTTATTEESTEGFDTNQELDYECNPWTRDETVFSLPEGVTFTEVKTS